MFTSAWRIRAALTLVLGALTCGPVRAEAIDGDLLDVVEAWKLDLDADAKGTRAQLREDVKSLNAAASDLKFSPVDREKKKEIEREVVRLQAQRDHLRWMQGTVLNRQLGTGAAFQTNVGEGLKAVDVKAKLNEARSDPATQGRILDAVQTKVAANVSDAQKALVGEAVTKARSGGVANLQWSNLGGTASQADKAAVVDQVKRAYETESAATPVKAQVFERNLEGSAAKLVANVEVKKVDGKDKVELSFDVKAQDNLSKENFGGGPRLFDAFENNEQRRKYIESIGDSIENKKVELDLDGKDLSSLDAATLKTKFDAAVDEADDKLLMGGSDSALKDGVKSQIERLGDKTKPGSDIANKAEEAKDYDGTEAKEKEKDLLAKKKVADWLKNAENDPGAMSSCEILVAALGGSSEKAWPQLPRSAREACADLSPESKQKIAQREKAEKAAEAPATAPAANGSEGEERYSREMQQLTAYCQAYRQNAALGSANKSIVDTIAPLAAGLDRLGATSSYLGRMLGDLADPQTDGLLKFFQSVGDQSQLQMILAEKAHMIATAETRDQKGEENLQKEKASLERMVSLAGHSLAQVVGQAGLYSPMGIMDPQIQADPKLQLLYRYYQGGSALLGAVTAELQTRADERLNARVNLMGGGGTGGMNLAPGSVPVGNGGSAAPSPRSGVRTNTRSAPSTRARPRQ